MQYLRCSENGAWRREARIEMIQTNRLDKGFFAYQQEFEDKALEVLRSGWYVMGKELAAFEEEFASYIGSKYCVGLGNGLDALKLAFRALGIGAGDEVIVQANTYIASVMGVTMNGATPVFVEPDEYFGIDADRIEAAVTDRTRAVLVVHLYGQACRMDKVTEICKKYGLKLVEDCAQCHGSDFGGQRTGTFGDVACFSFYPTKNLGAFGDAGAVTTDDEELAKKFRILRNYGSEKRYYNMVVGENTRLDELQAGLLRVRLSHLDELNEERCRIAARYTAEINNPAIVLPKVRENTTSVWHQYVIRCKERDRFAEYLKEREIATIIHYPIPPHLSQAYEYLGFKAGDFKITEQMAAEVLSIPIYNGLSEEDQTVVIKAINEFE